jgi:hypothetical protein
MLLAMRGTWVCWIPWPVDALRLLQVTGWLQAAGAQLVLACNTCKIQSCCCMEGCVEGRSPWWQVYVLHPVTEPVGGRVLPTYMA